MVYKDLHAHSLVYFSVNHNQHHQYFTGNFGLYFLWWDRWMGTLRSDYDQEFAEVKSRKRN